VSESNRRSFLAALGLTPVTALAFAPTPQQQTHKEIPKILPQKIENPAVNNYNSQLYECIVGDFQMNLNGHLYSKEIWESMFLGLPQRVVYSDIYEPALRLDHIVGHIVSYSFLDGTVSVTIRMIDTPRRIIFHYSLRR